MEVQRKKVMSRWKYVRQTEQLSHEIFDMLPLIRTSLESWDCLIFYDFFPPFSFFNCSHLTVQPVSFWIRHKCTYARTNKLAWRTVSIFMREKNTAFSSWVKNTIELWRITHLWTQYLWGWSNTPCWGQSFKLKGTTQMSYIIAPVAWHIPRLFKYINWTNYGGDHFWPPLFAISMLPVQCPCHDWVPSSSKYCIHVH